MTSSFNVLSDPWIPVEGPGGAREVGILDLLVEAHRLRGVVDPAPPIEFGLYRLLVALVTDALQLSSIQGLADALDAGRFPMDQLDRYVDEVGRERFDLFDADHPFLQTAGVAGDGTDRDSVARLFYQIPTGTNVLHFDHLRQIEHAVAPAVCARALTSIAPFMTQGGAGYSPSINGAPPWYLLQRGRSLFHTLLLNAPAESPMTQSRMHGSLGVPAWRSARPVVPKQERDCRTVLEGLTWQPRTVALVPSEGGRCTYSGRPAATLVREVVFTWGLKYSGSDWWDPSVAYRFTDKGRFSLRPTARRDPWRDTGPLLLLHADDYINADKARFERPAIVSQAERLRLDAYVDDADLDTFDLYGMDTNQAKVFQWRHEQLVIPVGAVRNPRAGREVQQASDLAERVAGAARSALRHLHPAEDVLETLVGRALEAYWDELEPQFRGMVLAGVARQDAATAGTAVELAHQWAWAVVTAGRRAVHQAADSMDNDAEALKRQQEARRRYEFAADRILHPEKYRDKRRRTKNPQNAQQGAKSS